MHDETTPPAQTLPHDDTALLETLTRFVLEAGLRPAVVTARWAAIGAAFHGFDPARVAEMSLAQVELLAMRPDLLRHRSKLRATVENARAVLRLSVTHGSTVAWLQRLADLPYEARLESLAQVFHRVGPRTAHRLLESLGLATGADWDDVMRSLQPQ